MFDLQYFILGVVQGLTEFLPISSSAHLIIFAELLDFNDSGLLNDIAVHVGTLGAVVIYLRKDIKKIVNDFFLTINLKSNEYFALKIIIATIPSVLIGFFIYQYLIYDLRNLFVIAYANIFFAIILYFVDRFLPLKNSWQKLSFKNAFLIGLCQSFAFIPGASRAGVTITGARLFGLKRDSAAIFSMLLSIPIILASICLTILDINSSFSSSVINVNKIIFSMLISFFIALISISFMMKILQKTNFSLFIVYRIILGIIILTVIN